MRQTVLITVVAEKCVQARINWLRRPFVYSSSQLLNVGEVLELIQKTFVKRDA